MKETIKKSIISGLIFSLTATSVLMIYAAVGNNWNDPETITASNGSIISSESWNKMLENINNLKSNTTIPSGTIIAYSGTSCPSGWLAADGSNGTFDLRGQFLRGSNSFDGGTTVRSDGKQDPDGLRSIGTYQADMFASHTHAMNFQYYASVGSSNLAHIYTNGTSGTMTSKASGGNETRSKNVAVIFCIKQ